MQSVKSKLNFGRQPTLKSGMRWDDVKAYLKARGVKYVEMCCYETGGPFSTLIRVGEEPAPWYCSEWTEFVALEFSATEPRPRISGPLNTDVPRLVHLTSLGTGCL